MGLTGARLRSALEPFRVPVLISLFVSILAIQIFLPPTVGMADNGDFARLTAGMNVKPAYPPTERYFAWFTPEYSTGPDPAPGPPWFFSGRLAAELARAVGWFKPQLPFDIRWVAFVHLWLLLLCFLLLLRVLRPAPEVVRWCAPLLAIWIFAGEPYAAYLNSLYAETMGFLALFAWLLALFCVFARGASFPAILLLAISGVLFALSKPVNAVQAIWMGAAPALLSAFAARPLSLRKPKRGAIVAAGLLTSAAGAVGVAFTPSSYSWPAVLDVVTLRLLKEAPHPQEVLSDFALLPSDIRYAGMNAYLPSGPGGDPAFLARFSHDGSATLIRWYARHPAMAVRFLWEDLNAAAPRQPVLGSFEKRFSPVRGAHAQAFDSWDRARSWLTAVFPAAIPLLYLAALALAGALVWYRGVEFTGFALVLAIVSYFGIVNFAFASLMDALETVRHLFLFQVSTDLLLFLLTTAAGRSLYSRFRLISYTSLATNIPGNET